jgi:hypothetical protein
MDTELPVIDTIDPPPPVENDQNADTAMEEVPELIEQETEQAPHVEAEYTTPPEQMQQDLHEDTTEQVPVSEDIQIAPVKTESEPAQQQEQEQEQPSITTTTELEPITTEIVTEVEATPMEEEAESTPMEEEAEELTEVKAEEPTELNVEEPTESKAEEPTELKAEEPTELKAEPVAEATTDATPPFLSAPASWQIPVAAFAQQQQQQQQQPQQQQPQQQKTLEPVIMNKSHLRKERFESRIKESKYDVEAWTGLINDAQQTGDLEVIRDIYERFLNVFPTSVSLICYCFLFLFPFELLYKSWSLCLK